MGLLFSLYPDINVLPTHKTSMEKNVHPRRYTGSTENAMMSCSFVCNGIEISICCSEIQTPGCFKNHVNFSGVRGGNLTIPVNSMMSETKPWIVCID